MSIPNRDLGVYLNESLDLELQERKRKPHKLEIFIDMCCPFCKKIMTTILSKDCELIKKYSKDVEIVLHPIIQAWHPQTIAIHEFFLAILLSTDYDFKAYREFMAIYFENQEEYFDNNSWDLDRFQIYAKLSKLASDIDGIDGDKILKEYLSKNQEAIKNGSKNHGNKVTDYLKQCIKFTRKRGIHVSPTVFSNSIEDGKISSSWTFQQFDEYLQNLTK